MEGVSIMYTPEQLARRNATPLTGAMMAASMLQLLVIIASYCFVVYYLSAGGGYTGALITFWLNIALLWVNTIIGMLWEKEIYGHYFMCREFFWEDAGNLAALISYNSYFVVLWFDMESAGHCFSDACRQHGLSY